MSLWHSTEPLLVAATIASTSGWGVDDPVQRAAITTGPGRYRYLIW